MILFTPANIGIYARASQGESFVLREMARLIRTCAHNPALAATLTIQPCRDSAIWDGLDSLQSITAPGLIWTLEDGDLSLIESPETT